MGESRRCFIEDKYISEEQCWEMQLNDADCDECEYLGKEEKPVCNDCKRDDVVLSPKGVCGACVAKADLKKSSKKETNKTFKKPRGTCSECKRPDMCMQARGMCTSCYKTFLESNKSSNKIEQVPSSKQSFGDITKPISIKILKEILDDLNMAITPKVIFCNDIDIMAKEAEEVKEKTLLKIKDKILNLLEEG